VFIFSGRDESDMGSFLHIHWCHAWNVTSQEEEGEEQEEKKRKEKRKIGFLLYF